MVVGACAPAFRADFGQPLHLQHAVGEFPGGADMECGWGHSGRGCVVLGFC